MRATVWGSRGSLATPGRDTLRYGGNTSCVELVLSDGTLLILDAGTGIRGLGVNLGETAPETIHLCLTHLHLDHLEGLGFFGPLWRAETELHIWGPSSPIASLHDRIVRYLSPPLFPLQLGDAPSSVVFHDVPEEAWAIGSATISAAPVSHPGPTVGYRIEEHGASLAYIPDHEPALGNDLRSLEPEWISGLGLAHGVTVLLHDSQYTEDEYPQRIGWGHSSVAHAVTFALMAHADRLVLFHHDPLHDDARLETLADRAHELWGGNGSGPELAYEGMSLTLGENGRR